MHGGIDEAGRGPVLGPLVVAGVVGDAATLWELGCRDSKKLSAANRERLARLLLDDESVQTHVEVLLAKDLDDMRKSHTLNEIEVILFKRVISALDAKHFVVDAADVNAARFGANVGADFAGTIDSHHKADADDGCVAAASILAKTTRDQHIEELRKRLERKLPMRIGSGYPSDQRTRDFIQQWHKTFGDLPPGTRRSWKTVQNLLGPSTTLGDFS